MSVTTVETVTQPRALYDAEQRRVWIMFGTRGPWMSVDQDGSVARRYAEPNGTTYAYLTEADAEEAADEHYAAGDESGCESGYDNGTNAARTKIDLVLQQYVTEPKLYDAIMDSLDEVL